MARTARMMGIASSAALLDGLLAAVGAPIVMAFIVMASIVMASIVMAHIDMACASRRLAAVGAPVCGHAY